GTPTTLRCAPPEHDQRRAVEVGGGDRAHPVGDAGTGGEHGDARAAGELGHALGRERGRLLVADVDDAPARLHGPVLDREDVPTRQGEDLPHAVAGESADDDLAAVRHQPTPSRKPTRASHHGSGFSTWGEWPASGITARRAPGIALAMRSEDPTNGRSCSPTITSVGTSSEAKR